MDLSVSSDEDIDNASDIEVVENLQREQPKEIIDLTIDEQGDSSIGDSSPQTSDKESHPSKKIVSSCRNRRTWPDPTIVRDIAASSDLRNSTVLTFRIWSFVFLAYAI
jgi:hypothetical protein